MQGIGGARGGVVNGLRGKVFFLFIYFDFINNLKVRDMYGKTFKLLYKYSLNQEPAISWLLLNILFVS